MKNHRPKALFQAYQRQTEIESDRYCKLRLAFEALTFPKQAAKVWRLGMLMEIWGLVSGQLGKYKDFKQKYEEGYE